MGNLLINLPGVPAHNDSGKSKISDEIGLAISNTKVEDCPLTYEELGALRKALRKPLDLYFSFYLPNLMIKPVEYCEPSLFNLTKAYCDAFCARLCKSSSQVKYFEAFKFYSSDPGVIISVDLDLSVDVYAQTKIIEDPIEAGQMRD